MTGRQAHVRGPSIFLRGRGGEAVGWVNNASTRDIFAALRAHTSSLPTSVFLFCSIVYDDDDDGDDDQEDDYYVASSRENRSVSTQ